LDSIYSVEKAKWVYRLYAVLTAKTDQFLQQLKQLVAKSPLLFSSLVKERNVEHLFFGNLASQFFNSAL